MEQLQATIKTFSFLQGGGEMGALIRAYDWADTPLGTPDQWPGTLRTTLGILLHSKFPMFLFWGPDSICFYNDAYRPSLGNGGKHPYALGKPAAEVWPETWKDIKPQIASVMNGGEATWYKDQLLPIYRNGKMEDVYWTYSYSPVLDDFSQPVGVFVTCTETTDNVVLVQQMQHSNEKAELAIESGELGVVEVDLQTQEVVISSRIENMFGLNSGSKRTDFLLQMHADDLVLREQAYQKAYQDGRLEYESRIYHTDGTERWIRLKGTVTMDADKKPLKMLAVVQDITEQKQFAAELERQVEEQTEELQDAHLQLMASYAYLQNIINIFTTPLQVLEPIIESGEIVDFKYKLTNEAYANYAGKKPAELEGRRVSEFFPGYFQTDSYKYIKEVATTGVAKLWDNHYEADGLNIHNEMGAVQMNGDVIVHLTDYTKLKQLQLQLERNITELKRSNENLEEFAHAASHDLKEPIRKIHFFTSLLKDQLGEHLNDVQRRSFERIEGSSQRMSNLIDDLLQYSHISQRPHEKDSVDVNNIISRVLEDLELHIAEKGAVFEVGPMPVVQGYKRQLQQLFQNLLSNAIKYSKPGVQPKIEVTASDAALDGVRYHVFSVKDNGIGFDETYKETIFQMFMRLHGKSEYTGTGVGLSIAKKVAENHNGFIQAQSTPGEGSVFSIYLPM
ncbi:PAS domain-containing sensor histidine kinase [Paracnuella aquatica]|uniref:PAS domain-containing sensor histidine kinase n=1 Tax=Paracnuella aquatica TaxID=2268757 RepID=UPI000F501ED9|nr:PAS domain-containing sensor histidine kinase [Paracnuella aquatica]RPD45078.1 PAS domain-containing sensor histidine kinase [Paracnuella aquatica]